MQSSFNRLQLSLIAIMPLLLSVAMSAIALDFTDDQPTEYQVKAAFLYNFTKFVEWPDSVFTESQSAITIGILGDDPFGKDIDNLITGEIIKGKKLNVKRFSRDQNYTDCQILFISDSEKDYLDSILKQLKKRPILNVSDIEKFAERGGIINFVIYQNRVRFEINIDAATQAGIIISSKLLRLAVIVGER